MEYYSYAAYRARIQLAVLDHNAYIHCAPKLQGYTQDYIYHCRYRKQTHNWDVVKVMERKEFEYIPELLEMITKFWEESGFTTRTRNALPSDHPSHIQRTIVHTELILNHLIHT